MRLCQHLLCDETATVYYRGPWCSKHSNLLGDRPAAEFRNAPAEGAGSAAAPRRPLDRDAASAKRRLSCADVAPAPISAEELVEILERDGWSLLDLEWELTQRLEEGA